MSSRSDKDLELWERWKNNGKKPEDFQKLKANFRGMIRSQTNVFANQVEIPPPAIQAEFGQQFARAVDTYDPSRGAKLSTWVQHNLQKGKSYITKHQNVVRMTEKRVWKVGDFQNAKSQLHSELNREPTTQELSERLKWHPREVGRMEAQLRSDYIASDMQVDPFEFRPSAEREALSYLPYELDDDEKFVYEHVMGINGKRKMTGTEIAQELGYSNAKVSRIRTNVAKKAKSLMEGDW